MIDLDTMIAAKTDQLNADDLRDQPPLTIKVTRVVGTGDADQPLAISFTAEDGVQRMPYKPGKSMRRLLREIWGKDGQSFVGKSMTIFCNKEVMFGKLKVGGIRISHIEGIDQDTTLALKGTKGAKQGYLVKPLRVQQQQLQAEPMPADVERLIADASTQDELVAIRADNEQKPFWPAVDQATRRRRTAIQQEQQQDGRGNEASNGSSSGDAGGDDGYDGI